MARVTELNEYYDTHFIYTMYVLDIVVTEFLKLLIVTSVTHSFFYIFEPEMLILDGPVVILFFFHYMH